jgi:hypothetical protein
MSLAADSRRARYWLLHTADLSGSRTPLSGAFSNFAVHFRDGYGLELKHDKAGVSLAAPRDPGIPPHSLPATLRMTGLSPKLSFSEEAIILEMHFGVFLVF